MHKQAGCWMNGTLQRAAEATISVFDHGLLYGDGVFEGIRFYNHCPFRLDAHLDRLTLSARAIALQLPYGRDELTAAVVQTIAAFGQANGYLRLVVTRGAGPMGLDPRGCGLPNVFLIADQLSLVSTSVKEQGAHLIIAATARRRPRSAPQEPQLPEPYPRPHRGQPCRRRRGSVTEQRAPGGRRDRREPVRRTRR